MASEASKAIIVLVEKAKTNPQHTVDENTRLLEDAGIDSIGVMELVETLQTELNVIFLPDDYSIENFDSVNSILALVERRRN